MQVSHQTVSRRLNQLEQSLGVRLINKHRHPWTLTVKGEEICKIATQMEVSAQEIVQFSDKDQPEFSGSVSITCVQWGFDLFVLPALKVLRQKHPELTFELISDDAPLDVQTGRADVAVRFTNAPPPDLIGRHIGPIPMGVFGVAEHMECLDGGQIEQVPLVKAAALATHQIWPPNEEKFQSIVRVNDFSTLVGSIRNGLGVAALPIVIGNRISELVASKTIRLKTVRSAWLLRNEDSRNSEKVRAVEIEILKLGRRLLDGTANMQQ